MDTVPATGATQDDDVHSRRRDKVRELSDHRVISMAQWSPSLPQLLSFNDQHGTVGLSLPQLLSSSDQNGTVEPLTSTITKFLDFNFRQPHLITNHTFNVLLYQFKIRVTKAQVNTWIIGLDTVNSK